MTLRQVKLTSIYAANNYLNYNSAKSPFISLSGIELDNPHDYDQQTVVKPIIQVDENNVPSSRTIIEFLSESGEFIEESFMTLGSDGPLQRGCHYKVEYYCHFDPVGLRKVYETHNKLFDAKVLLDPLQQIIKGNTHSKETNLFTLRLPYDMRYQAILRQQEDLTTKEVLFQGRIKFIGKASFADYFDDVCPV